jgi:hypothetical protein
MLVNVPQAHIVITTLEEVRTKIANALQALVPK